MNFKKKKYQKIINLLEDIDLYKKKLFLSFNKKNSFASIYGLIFSIFYYIFFITIFLYYLIELLNRKNFNINFYSYFQPYTKIDISNEPIFFGIYDQFGNIFDLDSYINFSVYFVNVSTDQTTKKLNTLIRPIETEKCDKNINLLQYLDIINIDNNYLSKFTCLRPNQNILITGHIGLENFTYLTIYLQKSINFNQTILESLVYEQRLIIFYLDFIIDHENYNHPLKRTIRAEDFKFIYNETHNFIYEISNSIYETEDYMIWSKKKKSNFFEYYKKSLNSITFNNYNFLTIDLKNSGYYNTYLRNYLKIDEVISKLIGLSNFVYFIISSFVVPIVNKKFNTKNINILNINVHKKEFNNIKNDKIFLNSVGSKNKLNSLNKENIITSLNHKLKPELNNNNNKNYSFFPTNKKINNNLQNNVINIYFDLNKYKYINPVINKKINPSLIFFLIPLKCLCCFKYKKLKEDYYIYIQFIRYILSYENLFELIINYKKNEENNIKQEKSNRLSVNLIL